MSILLVPTAGGAAFEAHTLVVRHRATGEFRAPAQGVFQYQAPAADLRSVGGPSAVRIVLPRPVRILDNTPGWPEAPIEPRGPELGIAAVLELRGCGAAMVDGVLAVGPGEPPWPHDGPIALNGALELRCAGAEVRDLGDGRAVFLLPFAAVSHWYYQQYDINTRLSHQFPFRPVTDPPLAFAGWENLYAECQSFHLFPGDWGFQAIAGEPDYGAADAPAGAGVRGIRGPCPTAMPSDHYEVGRLISAAWVPDAQSLSPAEGRGTFFGYNFQAQIHSLFSVARYRSVPVGRSLRQWKCPSHLTIRVGNRCADPMGHGYCHDLSMGVESNHNAVLDLTPFPRSRVGHRFDRFSDLVGFQQSMYGEVLPTDGVIRSCRDRPVSSARTIAVGWGWERDGTLDAYDAIRHLTAEALATFPGDRPPGWFLDIPADGILDEVSPDRGAPAYNLWIACWVTSDATHPLGWANGAGDLIEWGSASGTWGAFREFKPYSCGPYDGFGDSHQFVKDGSAAVGFFRVLMT